MKIVNGIAVVEGDLCISKWVEECGELCHDKNSVPLILHHIKEGDTVIDAGSNIGSHTLAYAQKVGKKGSVLAFEPNKKNFDCLEYNLKDYDNTEVFNWGLSDEACKIKMNDVPTNAGMSYAEKAKKGIKCVTIDSLELERLDFCKIDTEGMEYKILKGAEQTIRKYRPVMVIEINNFALNRNGTSDNDIYIYLIELGYEYRNIYPGGPLHAEQLDILCIPK